MFTGNFVIKSECGLASASSKMEGSIISLYVYPMGDNRNYVFAFTASSDTRTLRDYLSIDFITYRLFKGKNFTFVQGIKKGHGIMNSIFHSDGIPIFPIIAHGGTERFEFVTYDMASVESVFENVENTSKLQFSDYDHQSGDDLFNTITRKQSALYLTSLTNIERRILQKAYRSGYFLWPRMYNLGLLVKDFNLAKPTILYHLRNAERKILKAMVG